MRQTDRTKIVVDIATERSRKRESETPLDIDVLFGLLLEGSGMAARALEKRGVTVELLESRMENVLGDDVSKGRSRNGELPLSIDADCLMQLALAEAERLPKPPGLAAEFWPCVGTEHLLLALLSQKGAASALLSDALAVNGVNIEHFQRDVLRLLGA